MLPSSALRLNTSASNGALIRIRSARACAAFSAASAWARRAWASASSAPSGALAAAWVRALASAARALSRLRWASSSRAWEKKPCFTSVWVRCHSASASFKLASACFTFCWLSGAETSLSWLIRALASVTVALAWFKLARVSSSCSVSSSWPRLTSSDSRTSNVATVPVTWAPTSTRAGVATLPVATMVCVILPSSTLTVSAGLLRGSSSQTRPPSNKTINSQYLIDNRRMSGIFIHQA